MMMTDQRFRRAFWIWLFAVVVIPILRSLPIFAAPGQASSVSQQGTTPGANPFGRKYPARIYRTVRISAQPPVIDGRLDDPVWQEGEWTGDFSQQQPTEGAKPTQPTELKVLYDDRNI
jgi:hypothetical protein